jgi:putative ABC transport system substrate-binding protein
MRRREFIAGLGVAAAWPLSPHAQKSAMPVIGVLGGANPNDAEVARNLAAFRKGLAEAGFGFLGSQSAILMAYSNLSGLLN